MNSNTPLGKRVRRLAKKRGILLCALAEELKMSRPSLYQILSGSWRGGASKGTINQQSQAHLRLFAWLKARPPGE